MAGKGYTVGIASETKAFKQGVQAGIIDPLEDARKELDDLGRSSGPRQLEQQVGNAEDALRDLGNSTAPHKLEQQMRDAQQETKDLATETKRTADAIEREYKSSYRAAKQASDDGLDGMKAKSAEVSGELRQNLGETFSSFKGDLADLPQIAQDTLGGLAGSGALGGIPGLAATAAGAAGLGLISAAIQSQQEEAQKLKETFADAYKSAAEDGRAFLTDAEIQSLAIEIYFDPDKRAAAVADGKKLGVDLQTIVLAQAGDQDALATVIEKGNGKIREGTEAMRDKAKAGQNVIDMETAQTAGLEQLVGKYRTVKQITEDNAQAARDVGRLREEQENKAADAASRAQQADQTRWEGLAARYGQPIQGAVDVKVRVDDSALQRLIRNPPTVYIPGQVLDPRSGRKLI